MQENLMIESTRLHQLTIFAQLVVVPNTEST